MDCLMNNGLEVRTRRFEFEFQSKTLQSLTLADHESNRDMIAQTYHIRPYEQALERGSRVMVHPHAINLGNAYPQQNT